MNMDNVSIPLRKLLIDYYEEHDEKIVNHDEALGGLVLALHKMDLTMSFIHRWAEEYEEACKDERSLSASANRLSILATELLIETIDLKALLNRVNETERSKKNGTY